MGSRIRAPGAPWGTGYAEHNAAFFIFANVGTAGRTGTDHGNEWDGPDLNWAAKGTTTRDQAQMQRLLASGTVCHIFTRERDRDEFTYAGVGTPTRVQGERPVRLRWIFSSGGAARHTATPTPQQRPHGPYRLANTDATVSADVAPLSSDPALLERAVRQHAATQNALAQLVEAAGLVPHSPTGQIDYDLTWEGAGGVVLAEVKSLTAANEVAQIRHGLGQRFDYRAQLETAGDVVVRLVLALERTPSDVEHWRRVCASVGVTPCWAPHFEGVVEMTIRRV